MWFICTENWSAFICCESLKSYVVKFSTNFSSPNKMWISLTSHIALLSQARCRTGIRSKKYNRKCKILANAVPETVFAGSCTCLYIFQYISRSNQGEEGGCKAHIESQGQSRTHPTRRSPKLHAQNAGLHASVDSNISNGYQLFATKWQNRLDLQDVGARNC